MKLYIRALMIGASFMSIATSCSDSWLDRSPSDSVESSTAISSYSDAYTALIGVYDGLQEDENYYGARMFYYGDVRADDMQASSTSTRSRNCYLMNYTKDNSPQIWSTPYNILRNVNNLLSAIEQGKADDASQSKVDVLKAQALAVRALVHFDLVRVYGRPYTADNGESYGVPIVTSALAASEYPARNTVAEVYDQVISDLKESVSLFEGAADSKNSINSAYFNQWAAKALLARVYLYKGDNHLSLQVGQDVIEHSPASLWSRSEYVAAWEQANTSEMLFEIVNKNTSDWVDREALGYLMLESGYGDLHLTRTFLDLLQQDSDDVRNTLTKVSASDKVEGSTDRKYLLKYPGRADNMPQDVRVNNIPVLRLSEVYLNAAEAAFKAGEAGVAGEYLLAIAKRANPSTQIAQVSLERILEERRKELVGEGHRFFDLMRNNKKVKRYTSDADMYWHETLVDESREFDNSYYRAILPIPKSECDANPVIRKQQNPGY